jgi:hypothetical protein
MHLCLNLFCYRREFGEPLSKPKQDEGVDKEAPVSLPALTEQFQMELGGDCIEQSECGRGLQPESWEAEPQPLNPEERGREGDVPVKVFQLQPGERFPEAEGA